MTPHASAFGLLTMCFLMLFACTHSADNPALLTVPERSAYRSTALHAEVLHFIAASAARDARQCVVSFGPSEEGRNIAAVICADPPLDSLDAAARDPRTKVLIIGSIHPGECEGKEAIMELLRALAAKEHDPWLRELVLVFLPDYNPDGTDAVKVLSRESQAGPADGCGRRETSKGLDLNRDFTKVEAAETKALLLALRTLDPLLTIDCHTTNGSYHGFDLTYAGPLSPATDPALQKHARTVLLPALRDGMNARGLLTFDYGNWRGNWWPDEPPRVWESYDHMPRYVINGIGLRNRFSLLSEAYVHRPFAERIAATRALITVALEHMCAHRSTLAALARAADERASALPLQGTLPLDAVLADSGQAPIPSSGVVQRVDSATGRRELHHSGQVTWLLSETSVHFNGQLPVSVPWGFALTAPSPALESALTAHGIRFSKLQHEAAAEGESFAIHELRRAAQPFQGHRLVRLAATLVPVQRTLQPGTLVIPCGQPLCRLIMLLCEPRSPDGFVAWGLIPVLQHLKETQVACFRLSRAPNPRDK